MSLHNYKLSRRSTFILRGFTNKPEYGDRPPNINLSQGDLSADWEEFLDALGQIWQGSRVSQVFEVFKRPSDDEARFEVLIRDHSDDGFDILRARAVHGHKGELLSDQTDIKATHEAIHIYPKPR